MQRAADPKSEPIITRLQAFDPECDFAFTALRELKDSTEIRQFMSEYSMWLSRSAEEEVSRDPLRIAGENIGYIVGYCKDETIEIWKTALGEGLRNPILGDYNHLPDSNRALQVGEANAFARHRERLG